MLCHQVEREHIPLSEVAGQQWATCGITSGHARRAVADDQTARRNLTYEVHRTDWSTPPTNRRGLMPSNQDQASCIVL